MTPTDRPVRADAARNRELLLAAAEREFADKGLDASATDIAVRAGVGKGTLFRHFATKDDLIASIVCDHLDAVDAEGQRLLNASDPDGALFDFLSVIADQRRQRDVSFLIRATATNAAVAETYTRLLATVDALVHRAQRGGSIRPDVTGADVMLLSCAPNHVVEYFRDPPPGLWQRYLGVIFDGLRCSSAGPLLGPKPPPLQVVGVAPTSR